MNIQELEPRIESGLTTQQESILLGLNHIPNGKFPNHTDKNFERDMLLLFTPVLFEPEQSFRQEYYEFYSQVTESVVCKFAGNQIQPADPKKLQADLIKLGGEIGMLFKDRDDFIFDEQEVISDEDVQSYAISRVCDLMNYIYTGLNNRYLLGGANLAKREQISRGIFDVVYPFQEFYNLQLEEGPILKPNEPVAVFDVSQIDNMEMAAD